MEKIPESLLQRDSFQWRQTYSQQYLYFSWRAYQGKAYSESIKYLFEAARYSVNIVFSKSFIRLFSILSATTLVGENNYKKLRLLLSSSK